jgi:Peptidase family M48
MALTKILAVALFSATLLTTAAAQQPGSSCSPPFQIGNNSRNLFNEQQEEWLGDIMDQGMRRDYRTIEDPNGYLQRIGERLLAQLPPTQIHYHFVITDAPGLNSFGLAGGRIYIYRRMVAFAKNEDELAALLGHEIGHMVVHQVAIHMSDYLRALGITSVGDRQDVLDEWNRFKDNSHKIKRTYSEGTEEQEQVIADRIGLYAMTRAGYDPAKYADFADRSFETKGKTGNFWTDFFGTTTPQSKRLREIIKNTAPLPADCVSAHPDTAAFAAWRQQVIESKTEVAKEDLPGLVRKVALQPPLRNELTYLQFSPDGKYLLAQDDGSIFLLRREPLANLFHIDAARANNAQFTPDSKAVVFDDPEMRVQKWDIASQRQAFIRELPSQCRSSLLSPAGDVLACVRNDRELQMIDVATGDVLFSKKNFYDVTRFEAIMAEFLEELGLPQASLLEVIGVQLHFSPDGRYLVASHGEYSVAYDTNTRSEIKLPGKIKALIRSNFIFTSPNEVFGLSEDHPRKSLRLKFPGGELVQEFPFAGYGVFSPTVQSNYVMVKPAGIAAIGSIDFNAQKTTMGYKTPGFAIFRDLYAGDDVEGLITLYKIADKSQIAHVKLPDSPLAGAKATAFSADGQWLAISGRSRGAVWRLDTGARLGYSRDFDGAFFDGDGLIARFPKRLQEAGKVALITPSPLSMKTLYELEPAEPADAPAHTAHTRTWQDEDLLVRLAPTDTKKFDALTLDVRDIRTNKSLWQLDVGHSRPHFYYLRSGKTVTFIIGNYDRIRDTVKQDPALSKRLDAIGDKKGKEASYLIQVFDSRSRDPLGNVLVDTGKLSFRVENAATAGDNVFISDSLNRTLVYSLKSGNSRGSLFGKAVAVSAGGDKVLVENGPGAVDLYDATSLQSLTHFAFPARVAHAEFTGPDSLMVLTADQIVYQFTLGGHVEKMSLQ